MPDEKNKGKRKLKQQKSGLFSINHWLLLCALKFNFCASWACRWGFVFAKPLFSFLVIIYRLSELACFHMHLICKPTVLVLGCGDGKLMLPSCWDTQGISGQFPEECSVLPPTLPIFFPPDQLLPTQKHLIRQWCLTSYSPAAAPAQAWHQWWSRVCQPPHGKKGHEVGETELSSAQKETGLCYKLGTLNKRNGNCWKRQVGISCLVLAKWQIFKSGVPNQV